MRVNGRIVTELGTKVDGYKDRVEVDGRRLVAEKPVYYLMHKPREMVTTLDDPQGRATITELFREIPERVVPVGRLDYHTSGALLATNDGDMVDAEVVRTDERNDLAVLRVDAIRRPLSLHSGVGLIRHPQ